MAIETELDLSNESMAIETEPAAPPRLLGPPVVRGARPSADSAAVPASHPFLDLLDAAFNAPSDAEIRAAMTPRRALTENCSATSPADAGKSDKEGFYAAALWMHENHPKTLACNVAALAEFGYLKDFPELLFRLIHGPDVRKVAKAAAEADKARKTEKELVKRRAAFRTRLASRPRRRRLVCLDDELASPPLPPVPPKATLGDFLAAALYRSRKAVVVEAVPVSVAVPEAAEQKPEAMEAVPVSVVVPESAKQKPEAIEVAPASVAAPEPESAE
ncbi:hypothetical protein ZWY2020_036541 [Hordeum vulgare]|nr:hypothetical protein ZWY2020_036541 [Hordeum vulgare]